MAKETSAGSWKFVAADEASIVAKPLFYPIVVESSEGDGGFPDSACADESDGAEGVRETDDLLDQLITTETGSRPRGR